MCDKEVMEPYNRDLIKHIVGSVGSTCMILYNYFATVNDHAINAPLPGTKITGLNVLLI